MMDTNWQKYLTLAAGNYSSVIRAVDISRKGEDPFIQLRDNLIDPKKYVLMNVPIEFMNKFTAHFNLEKIPDLGNLKLGKIVAVNDRPNYREALFTFPITFFTNTSYRRYLENFEGIKMRAQCLAYLAIAPGHPMFNYIDEGNHFYTKFFLDYNGLIYTKLGKAGDSYQYFSIFDKEINPANYMEQYFVTPYRKKVLEISQAFAGRSNESYEPVNFKDVNIAGTFHQQNILFEVDAKREADLKGVPKKELLQFAQVKENVELSRQLLNGLPALKEDEYIELPTKLRIYPKRIVYAGQELSSTMHKIEKDAEGKEVIKATPITSEFFLFNTKKTFPAFGIDNMSDKYIYTPPLAENSAETLNWDQILGAFVRYHWIKATQFTYITMRIGTVDIKLEYKKDRKLFYINEKRINKDEVPDVLMKALCARTQEDYDIIVSAISKTSLEMHKFINEGLNIQLNLSSIPDFLNNSQYLKGIKSSYFDVSFKIVRLKNLNYIELLEKKKDENGNEIEGSDLVRISDSRVLLSINNQTVQWNRLGEIFGEGTKVLAEPIDLKLNAAEIIEKARKRYIAAFEKSKQLLNSVIEELGAKIIDFHGKKGVVVKGASGTEYFIAVSNLDNPAKGDPECTVYHYPSNTHICIVDKLGNGRQTGLDKVVARMYALANDSVLAEHIHTIRGYVNKSSK